MKMTAPNIIDALGAHSIAVRAGVTKYAVRHAKTAGIFPASWFRVVRELCAERGVDCPEDVFNFKSPSEGAPTTEAAE